MAGVEVQLHLFITSVLDGVERSNRQLVENNPVLITQHAGWGPETVWKIFGKKEILFFLTGSEIWTVQPADCRYSDYATSAANCNKLKSFCKEVVVTYFKVEERSGRDIFSGAGRK